MRIIKPQVDFINEKNPLKRIERVARVCWGTEDKITENSAKPFCERLLKMGHTSPFEHAKIKIPMDIFLDCANCTNGSPYGYHSRWQQSMSDGRPVAILNCRDFLAIGGTLDKIENLPISDDFATVRFTVDIGVSRELIRHRQMSFMERSTRYVNMKSGIDFILPLPFDWAEDKIFLNGESTLDDRFADPRFQTWYFQCETAEWSYQKLIAEKCSPQEARSVLPLSTATILYVSGTYSQWNDLLKLRCDKSAHPQMRHAMTELLINPDCPDAIKSSVLSAPWYKIWAWKK